MAEARVILRFCPIELLREFGQRVVAGPANIADDFVNYWLRRLKLG
jgi:hypothetical protein